MRLIKLNILTGLIILFAVFAGCDTQEQKTEDMTKFNKLSWMENVWKGTQGDAKLYESWHKKNFRILEGISYTSDENGRRVYSQDMRLEQNNNQIFFTIKLPGNQLKTFDLVSVTDSCAVFENEDNNGYPETITYQRKSDGRMTVSLEGENAGTEMDTKLNYEKD